MVTVKPIFIDNFAFTATHVALPKTNLLSISNDVGYVMCGALDVELLRTKLADRGIIAARATGVKTMDELIEGTVESCTQGAEVLGIHEGMSMRDALRRIGQAACENKSNERQT